MKHLGIAFSILLYIQVSLFGQQLENKYNDSDYALIDEFVYEQGRNIHTSIKPYSKWKIDSVVSLDSIYTIPVQSRVINWAINKEFIEFKKDEFWFTVNPYINFELAQEGSKSYYKNTRGLHIDASIGKKVAFHTAFNENQGSYPYYMEKQILDNLVIPGQGLKKNFRDGFDYAYAEGYVSYSPSKYFNFKFGHGKNFLGDGYNSLLLSDRAFNYPHLKITTDIWHLKYVNIFAQFMDIDLNEEHIEGFKRKNATIHYLSWNTTKWLNISLFESIIWESGDSTYHRGFDVNYLNPIILYRPVEFSLGSPDNAMLGLNVKISPLKNSHIYSQLVLDEFKLSEVVGNTGWWANKAGLQVGVKSFHSFGKNKFFIQGEYSLVRPFTYSHFSNSQNYGHYNEPLAHPLGANFKQALARVKYSRGRFQVNAILQTHKKGLDSTKTQSWGGNIYKPYTLRTKETGNFILQGVLQTVGSANIFASYLINYRYNLNISAGIIRRMELINDETINNTIFYFALRTSLNNIFNY